MSNQATSSETKATWSVAPPSSSSRMLNSAIAELASRQLCLEKMNPAEVSVVMTVRAKPASSQNSRRQVCGRMATELQRRNL